MNFEKILNLFVSNCLYEKMAFSDADVCHFSKACNVKVDHKYLDFYFKNLKFPNYVSQKSLFGPCIFHPKEIYFKDFKYNIKGIINDTKLSNQNISPDAKMQKIIDYHKFLKMS